MPTTVSYPGLYIEELPLSAHSIQAAPTSITAIVGYTHPFKTKPVNFGQAVRLFSFTDYQREFGGNFASGLIPSDVPLAVNQFFLNGGSDLYVVAIAPEVTSGTYQNAAAAANPTVNITTTGSGIRFNALEPNDLPNMGITVTLSNVRQTTPGSGNPYDLFDVTIIYGNRVETFRNMSINPGASSTQALAALNTKSSLVTVDDGTAGSVTGFGTDLGSSPILPVTIPVPVGATVIDPARFTDIFGADTALDKVPVFNILLTPGRTEPTIMAAALYFAERKRAFFIMDPPINYAADTSGMLPCITTYLPNVQLGENGALYFPYLQSTDPVTGLPTQIAPSGYVAGIYARTDNRRGVWKAPAGIETTIVNTTGVVASGDMTNEQQGVLYGTITGAPPINCLRSFPGTGTVVFGARTLVGSNSAYAQSKYVPVRRMTLFIEQTLLANLRWVVFEPNAEPLWISIRTSIENFMLSLYNQGALQGTKASDAFQVSCDSTTTTQDDINNGIVNIIVAFAPLKPAEFVVIKIAQLAGQPQS